MSLAIMTMMTDINTSKEIKKEYKPRKKHKKVIPNGCKEYVFNEVFGTLKVIAISEKSALNKYNKWCSKNS